MEGKEPRKIQPSLYFFTGPKVRDPYLLKKLSYVAKVIEEAKDTTTMRVLYENMGIYPQRKQNTMKTCTWMRPAIDDLMIN